MNREIMLLREVITKLVPLLTGRGLRVTQIGSNAYVRVNATTKRPEIVNIPNVSDNATPEFIKAIQGFIDHEVAHVLITEWDIYYSFPKGMSQHHPLAKPFNNLMNIFEDTMIEKEIVKTFPGSRTNLSNVRKYFLERISQPAVKSAKTDQERFLYLMVPAARALAGHIEMQEWMDANGYWQDPGVEAFVKALPESLKKEIATASSTRDVFKIVEQVFPILYPPQPEAQPQPKSEGQPQPKSEGQSQDKPEKQAGEGDGDGERDHSQQEEDGEAGEGEDEPGKTGKGEKDEDEGEDDQDDGKSGAEDDGKDDTAEEDAEEKDGEGSDDDDQDAKGDAGDDGEGDDAGDADAGDESGDEAAEDADGESAEGDSADDGADADDGDDAEGSSADGLSGEDAEEEEGKGKSKAAGEAGDEEGEDKPGEGSGERDEAPKGAVGEFSDEIPEAHDAAEDGGGVGNGMSLSMFDFKEDALDGLALSEAIAEKISEAATAVMQNGEYVVLTRDFDEVAPLVPPEQINKTWIPKMEDEVRAMTGKMQKDIERIMASQSHVIRTPGHRKGKLHGASLYRVLQNDDRVFSQKQEHRSKDTAVTLLCDNSGSMSGHKMRLAMISAYALCSTLDRVKITNEVLGFTTGMSALGTDPALRHAVMEEQNNGWRAGIRYDRVIPIVMPIYKSFDEKLSPMVKKRIAYAMNAQRGLSGNIDGESLEYAAGRLLRRMEKRKVMIVLSDGQPAGGPKSGWHLRETVLKLGKLGIDVLGIGIQDKSVKHYYPKHVVLEHASALPGLVMGEIKQLLSA